MTNIEELTGKALMTTNPSERQWYEDQITINLYARRLLIGNSRVVVIDGGDAGCEGYDVAQIRDMASLKASCDARGWQIVLGSVLFTARDNPRKYPTSARAVAERATAAREAAGWVE